MKVSLRSTYGIMAVVDMANQAGAAPIQTKSIARRQGIPARFLEQVLHAMKKAGLVTSLRGAQGGYVLSKKPAELSVAQIIEALEGPLDPFSGNNGQSLVRSGTRFDVLLANVWNRVHHAERTVLDGISVEELADRYRRLQQQKTLMYHI
jgi:Rrf2 family protein